MSRPAINRIVFKCQLNDMTLYIYIYNSDYSPHPQRDGIVESAPKMVQLPAFRIGQFPYFNLNLSPSSSRYFHFFFTSSLLTNSSQVKQTCIFFRKPDFIWFFHPIFSRGMKNLLGQSRISFHCTGWGDEGSHPMKIYRSYTHVEKACWKNDPKLENANIYLPWKQKTSTYIFQLDEVPG